MNRRSLTFRRGFVLATLSALALGFALRHTSGPDLEPPVPPPPAAPERPTPGELGGPHALEGQVLAADGERAEGVLVSVVSGGRVRWAYTNELGVFRLEGLAAGELELALVPFDAPASTHAARVPGEVALVLRLLPGRDAPEFLPRVVRTGRLAGRVAVPFEGDPTGFRVSLLPIPATPRSAGEPDVPPLDGSVARHALADADGAFELADLAHGRYLAIVVPPFAGRAFHPRLLERSVDVGPDTTELDLFCEHGRVVGAVRDPAGGPLPGALVELERVGRPQERWPPVFAGDDGAFAFDAVPAGSYRVVAHAGDGRAEALLRVAPLREERVDLPALAPRVR